VIIGAVVVVAAVVAAVVQHRRIDEYQQSITRVQVEANRVGEALDLSTFPGAWASASAGQGSGVVPQIAGARVSSVTVSTNPPTVVIDYEISQSGEQACVRLTRTAGGTEITEAEVACPDFTFAPTL
jgi:hypothetical protein